MSGPVEPNTLRSGCAQFDMELPAFLEGENRPFVARHVAQCEFCAIVLGDLQLLRSEALDFPLEEPPATLWANIRANLEAEGLIRNQNQGLLDWLDSFGHAGGIRFAFQFGAAACLLLVGLVLLSPTASKELRRNVASVEPASAAQPTLSGSNTSATFLKSLEDMEASYRERAKALDPQVRQSYQRGLQSLNDSIRECQVVVQEHPNDSEAREYLTSAYEQKAAVLMTALEYDGR